MFEGLKESFEKNPKRTVLEASAFMGTSMLVMNTCSALMPDRFGLFRRLVCLAGSMGLAYGVGGYSADKMAEMYDIVASRKKYNANNETLETYSFSEKGDEEDEDIHDGDEKDI